RAFAGSLPLAALFQAPTIAQLAEMLRGTTSPVAASPVIPLQREGHLPPFFCVYQTLADVRRLRSLARSLGTDQPCYGLQLSAAEGQLPDAIRMEETARHLLEEMRAVQPTGPYYLGGYCFGGVLAFEMAQQLQAAGKRVGLLVLID